MERASARRSRSDRVPARVDGGGEALDDHSLEGLGALAGGAKGRVGDVLRHRVPGCGFREDGGLRLGVELTVPLPGARFEVIENGGHDRSLDPRVLAKVHGGEMETERRHIVDETLDPIAEESHVFVDDKTMKLTELLEQCRRRRVWLVMVVGIGRHEACTQKAIFSIRSRTPGKVNLLASSCRSWR